MNKILIISYDFPPIAKTGIFRVVKFAKYLPKFGWQPFILTVKNPDKYMANIDSNFLNEKLSHAKIFRAFSVPLGWITKLGRLRINYKWLFGLDPYIGWILNAIRIGKKIILKENIHIIYATCPPITNLLVGLFLKRITKKPLIIEYRDLWLGNPFSRYPTRAHLLIEKKMETMVLKNCSAIITIGELERKKLLKLYPFLQADKTFLIPNGYDPQDFTNIWPHDFQKFTILHAGTIYEKRLEHLISFLEALSQIVIDDSPDLQLILLGHLQKNIKSSLLRIIYNLKLDSTVQILKAQPYKKALQMILGANVLLLIPGDPINVTNKIFDYLANNKFILNIDVPKSETAKIIKKAQSGVTVKPDTLAIYNLLSNILQRNDYGSHIDKETLQKYSRINHAKKLATILNQC